MAETALFCRMSPESIQPPCPPPTLCHCPLSPHPTNAQMVETTEFCRMPKLQQTATLPTTHCPLSPHPTNAQMVETVVFCRMSKLQQSLYSHFLASPPVQRALQGKSALHPGADQPGNLQALPAITALKKLCCHPDLIYAMQTRGVQQPLSERQANSGRGAAQPLNERQGNSGRGSAAASQRASGGAASGTGTGSAPITGFEGECRF